jgi:TatD DNase family protein
MKNLFDSHAHVNMDSYTAAQRAEVIASIENSDLAGVVDVGFDIASSKMAMDHASKYPWCYAGVGVHPHEVEKMTDDDLDLLAKMLDEPKVVALGEIGLDYYKIFVPKEIQKKRFVDQLQVAFSKNKPVLIHDRDSHEDVFNILTKEKAFSKTKVLLHCYSGSSEQAKQYIGLGATLSIAGPLTFKNNHKTVEVVREIGLEHMLIETDAPFLTPEPHRGKRNISPYVEFVARKIAEIKELSYEEVAEKTLENAKRFFDIN